VHHCPTCDKNRPLTIIADDGVCGHCKWDEGSETPGMDEFEYLQARCYRCGTIYSRDARSKVSGRSKCHGCRYVGAPPPSAKCKECDMKFVQYFKPEAGLPNSVCFGCANGMRKRVIQYNEFPAYASQIFPGQFPILCKSLGLLVDEGTRQFFFFFVLTRVYREVEAQRRAFHHGTVGHGSKFRSVSRSPRGGFLPGDLTNTKCTEHLGLRVRSDDWREADSSGMFRVHGRGTTGARLREERVPTESMPALPQDLVHQKCTGIAFVPACDPLPVLLSGSCPQRSRSSGSSSRSPCPSHHRAPSGSRHPLRLVLRLFQAQGACRPRLCR
jgi:hypothetical protein